MTPGDPPCWAHLLEESDVSSREDVRRLVVEFYRDVAMDDVLGPVFAAAGVDWPAHLDKLTDFWSWQLLGEAIYERNPLRAHEPVHQRTPLGDAHYERWLALFRATVDRMFAGANAETAKQRATKMATAMRRLLDGESGAADVAVDVMPVRPARRRQLR